MGRDKCSALAAWCLSLLTARIPVRFPFPFEAAKTNEVTTVAWFHNYNGQTFVVDARDPAPFRVVGENQRVIPLPQTLAPAPQQTGAPTALNGNAVAENLEHPEAETPNAQGGEVTTTLALTQAPVVASEEADKEALPTDETTASPFSAPLEEAQAQQPDSSINKPIQDVAKKTPEPEEANGAPPALGAFTGTFEANDDFPTAQVDNPQL